MNYLEGDRLWRLQWRFAQARARTFFKVYCRFTDCFLDRFFKLARLLKLPFRIAAFNAYNNTFKIIDLVTSTPLLSVDLRQEVEDSWQFFAAVGSQPWSAIDLNLDLKLGQKLISTLINRQAWAQCSAAGSSTMQTGLEATLSFSKRSFYHFGEQLTGKYPRCRSWRGWTGCWGWCWWRRRRTGRGPMYLVSPTSFLDRK